MAIADNHKNETMKKAEVKSNGRYSTLTFPTQGRAPRLFLEYIANNRFLHWITANMQVVASPDDVLEDNFSVRVDFNDRGLILPLCDYINANDK